MSAPKRKTVLKETLTTNALWNDLHLSVSAQIASQTTQDRLFSLAVEIEFKRVGVKLSVDEKARIRAATIQYLKDGLSVPFEHLNICRRGNKVKQITLSARSGLDALKATQRAAEIVVPKIARDVAKSFHDSFLDEAAVAFSVNDFMEGHFRRRLGRTYRSAFTTLAHFNAACIQMGHLMLQVLTTKGGPHQTPLRTALLKLHHRACRAAEEARILLEAGFADGAMARWRTMYELSVYAAFLQEHGEVTAKRYLAFEVYERKKLTDTHLKMQDSSSIDGANPFDAAVDQLKADYGNDFARDCGWAASVLKKKRVCFTDIENATEFSSARLYYEQASKAVHASSLGMNYRPSMDHVVENGDQLEFAVATNVGLVTPAMLSAWSLMCITLTLLSSSTNVDRLVAMHFLRRFEPEVRRKFHAAENRIAKREKNKKINKLPRSKLHGIQE